MIPSVKKYKNTGERFALFSGFTAVSGEGFVSRGLRSFSAGMAELSETDCFYFVISKNKTPALPELLTDHPEGYTLHLSPKLIAGCSKTAQGLFYAYKTFQSLIENDFLPECEITDYPHSAFRAFHMDMRYGFPSLTRMMEIIDALAAFKYNTFILEYENRFPYEKYSDICDTDCFTKEEIAQMIAYAEERYIEIVPLQQTIGHLEYLLKNDAYYPLREMRNFPETEQPFCFNPAGFKHFNNIDEICACSQEAYEIIERNLQEVIEAHPNSQYVHIGCDEAWNLLSCPKCKEKYGDDKNKLYLEHINRMADSVVGAGKIPMIWDDMLQSFGEKELSLLCPQLVVVCWLYYGSQHQKAIACTEKYQKAGFRVLGASAAKCSEGPEPQYLDIPWYPQRTRGIDMWAAVCEEKALDGFCHTCWSNYSGTIAPPHPFFDTAWYTVAYAAQKLWNRDADLKGFDAFFIHSFFGVPDKHGGFDNRNEQAYTLFEDIEKTCTKHKYEAAAMKVMSLLSAYRLKSLFVHRELYRLTMDITSPERRIIQNRLAEVKALRERLIPELQETIGVHYTKKDCEIFINSRFGADITLEKAYGMGNV